MLVLLLMLTILLVASRRIVGEKSTSCLAAVWILGERWRTLLADGRWWSALPVYYLAVCAALTFSARCVRQILRPSEGSSGVVDSVAFIVAFSSVCVLESVMGLEAAIATMSLAVLWAKKRF